MKTFADLPEIEMTVEQIFAANQKANATIPIRRVAKNNDAARASTPQTPDASAFAASTDAPVTGPIVAPQIPLAAQKPAAAQKPTGLQTSANLGAQPVSRRKWGELWIPLAIATLLLAGIGGGWVYAWASDVADHSVFLTWAAIGFGVGLAFLPAIRWGKNRSVAGAITFVALTCALVYGSMLGWSALRWRAEMLDFYAPVVAKKNKVSLAAARAQMERRITPTRAVAVYLGEMNRYGISLLDSDKSRVSGSSGNGGIHLDGIGFWAYFVFQIGITALIAGGLASSFAKAPFHEGSGTWYRKFAAYALHPAHVAPLLQLCRESKWAEAGRLSKQSKTGGSVGATATVYFLPGQGGFVRVSSSQQSGSKTLFETTLNDDEVKLWKPI